LTSQRRPAPGDEPENNIAQPATENREVRLCDKVMVVPFLASARADSPAPRPRGAPEGTDGGRVGFNAIGVFLRPDPPDLSRRETKLELSLCKNSAGE
jgi:hypothetical protein